ncbi:hypothetical protein LOTGIDRAFT_234868 [Lottia gigantea]|uniref:Magnesium-dependent phosphatase 1 n=1 Tax=Lottia gigantea TaxID=225164 RepID=V3ZU36_LOTGI|nr:hypothetical protein LOTGIDRAFT_234868 [Lottia gigantea]ESO87862.1 hypothetical protein LOTGIDRAFT_234868 [Lottia gigantea]
MAGTLRPKLIVFDLDYTLWPFWVDTHVTPPFKKQSDGKVYDKSGKRVKYYPDVPAMLQKLHSEGYTLAVASRTGSITEANSLVSLFKWDKYLKYKEIYPGSKIAHFKKFQSNSGVAHKDMLFFDDEHRNIVEVGALGVTCVHAADGMKNSVLQQGLQMFQMKNS